MRIALLYIAFISVLNTTSAQNKLNKDSLISDFNYLKNTIEQTHPEPYEGFGGKLEFFMEAEEIKDNISNENHTIESYSKLLLKFVSKLNDGHTAIEQKKTHANNKKNLPISVEVIPEGIIINNASENHDNIIGTKLLSINNFSIDILSERLCSLSPCENKFGSYLKLKNNINNNLETILEISEFTKDKDHITLTLQSSDGEIVQKNISFSDNNWNRSQNIPKGLTDELEYIDYKFLDNKKQIMFMKMQSVMDRECFAFMKKNNWPSFSTFLTGFYNNTLKKRMPEDTDKAINGIPDFSEIFSKMLSEMKKSKSKTLIIDLRSNSGGFTPITQPSLYMLYGDRYIQKDMQTHFYKLISPLLMNKMNTTLEKFNNKNHTDYSFGDFFTEKTRDENTPIEELRKKIINNSMSNKTYINNLNGTPIYTPSNIYVLTNAETFSGAFHYAFYLWKMGATIVGTPSSQAPNTYMESTNFELPYTKLKGSVSNSTQLFLPKNHSKAEIFWPELMLNHKDYKKYNFNKDSELFWLMDYINKNSN